MSGDVIIAPFSNSVEGAEEVDVNVDLVTSAAVVAEYASKNASNASNATAGPPWKTETYSSGF